MGQRAEKRASKRDQTAMNPNDLPQTWREQAELQRSLGCTEAACTFEHCAKELASSLKSYADETLTIAEAAKASGYDDETLRRLVRAGTIRMLGNHTRQESAVVTFHVNLAT